MSTADEIKIQNNLYRERMGLAMYQFRKGLDSLTTRAFALLSLPKRLCSEKKNRWRKRMKMHVKHYHKRKLEIAI